MPIDALIDKTEARTSKTGYLGTVSRGDEKLQNLG